MTEPTTVLMARQPIFDRDLRVVAYELLYRSDDAPEVARVLNGQHATCNVLLNAYSSIIEQQKTRQLPVFLNLPREMLETDTLPTVSSRQVVFEVLNAPGDSDVLIESIRRYKQAGYRIALDHFSYDSALVEVLDLVDIVKLDVRALGLVEIEEQVRLLKGHRARLLATKIKTHDELSQCIEMGFQLYQGQVHASFHKAHLEAIDWANRTLAMMA